MDLVARAKNMLLSPQSEWKAIAVEPADVGALYSSYIVPMAAIPPVCGFIGFTLFLGRFGFGFGLVAALLQYALALAGVYVAALVVQWLGPKFGGSGDFIAALKLIAYAHTASWVAGFFMILPFLWILGALLSLYGFYLLYAGAVPVMGVPGERAVTFTGATVLSVIAVVIVIGFVLRLILGIGMVSMM
jgi:Yip1 domain